MAHGGACGAEHDEPLATRALSGEWSGEPRPKPATRKNVFNGIRHHRDKGDTSSGSICYYNLLKKNVSIGWRLKWVHKALVTKVRSTSCEVNYRLFIVDLCNKSPSQRATQKPATNLKVWSPRPHRGTRRAKTISTSTSCWMYTGLSYWNSL